MAQAAEQLVGRADELGSFDRLLEELDRGGSSAVVLVGEPGIGKTRLLAELAAQADARGHLVLVGSASELERDVPFWVFVDAIEEYVGRARARPVRRSGRRRAAQSWRSSSRRSPRSPAGARWRSSTSATAAIARCASCWSCSRRSSRSCSCSTTCTGPTRPRSSCSARCCTGRPRRRCCSRSRCARARWPSGSPARSGARNGPGRSTRFELGALSRGEAAELLGERVDGAEAGVLYEETGGNPFYLEQLARMRDRAGRGTSAEPEAISLGGVQVPPTVAAALAEELALLSDGARRLLEGAAVVGDPFDPELAAAASGTPEPAALDALDELLRLDVVRPTDVPRRFRFRHPLVRRAVYETTPGGWRLGAHERCAEALLEPRRLRLGARTPRRALGPRGRPGGGRDPSRGGRGGRAARAGECRTLVRRGAADPSRGRLGRGAGRAAAGALGSARRHRPVRRQPRHAAREPEARPRRCGRAASAVDRRVRRRRAAPRPASGGARPPRGRRQRAGTRRLRGGGRARDRARRRQPLSRRLRRAWARGRSARSSRPVRSTTACSWPPRWRCAPSRRHTGATPRPRRRTPTRSPSSSTTCPTTSWRAGSTRSSTWPRPRCTSTASRPRAATRGARSRSAAPPARATSSR